MCFPQGKIFKVYIIKEKNYTIKFIMTDYTLLFSRAYSHACLESVTAFVYPGERILIK